MLHIEPPLSRLDFSIASSKAITRRHGEDRARGIPWPEILWPSVVAGIIRAVGRLSRRDCEEFLYRHIQTGHSTSMSEETASLLRNLKKLGFVMGVASNAQNYTLRELAEALAVHGLAMDMFEPDLCFWSFEHGFSKPDPHVFQILTARLLDRGVAASEILMAGDRLDNDIQPATAHGWQSWQFRAPAGGGGGGWTGLLDKFNTHRDSDPI